ncbi:MAG: glycosyltransferase [Verrucomicrobiae bacterium]|nr:glycosyltransferase [Verrucomicrobiae bacterium]
MDPRISIVTPSFNQARYVEECIRSVLDQDYPNAEHIIFDGGSQDGTVEVLRRYENRGVRWKSEPDKGQSDAINKGFRAATGEIIGWINSDDWYVRGAFRVVADYFRAHPEADFVYGNNFFTDPNRRVIRRVRTMPYRWEWLLHTGLLIPQPGVFVRRKVVEDCGLLDISLRCVMDYEWWLRIARKHPPHFIDRYLACFRIHPGSITGSGRLHELWRRERWEVSQKYQPCSRAMAHLQRIVASGGKLMARWWRALTGPGETSLYCVPRVVVLCGRLTPERVDVLNVLQDRHDLEAQVWTLPGTEKPQMSGPHHAVSGATKQIIAELWRERPSVVVVTDTPSGVRRAAAIYCALARAKLIDWTDPAPWAVDEFCRMLRRD